MTNVVAVIDPRRQWIRGPLHSARFEYDHIRRSYAPGRPPKDLTSIYASCVLHDKTFPGMGYSLPIIIDDETRMWPSDQHDNIIVVKPQVNTDAWNVPLIPTVSETLRVIHTEFFKQLDAYKNKPYNAAREPPSARNIYKTYLRSLLGDLMAGRLQQRIP